MTGTRHIVQLVLAALAAVAAGFCWSQVRTWVDVPPITDGQPPTVSVVYHPPLMMLAWLLATVAGVLLVLAVSGFLRAAARRPGVKRPGSDSTPGVPTHS